MSGSSTVLATDGAALPLDVLEHTYTNNGTVITSDAVVYVNPQGVTKTYTQTYTYSGSFISDISQWVPS